MMRNVLFGIVALVLLCMSTNAYAKGEHTGWDLEVQLNAPITDLQMKLDYTHNKTKEHKSSHAPFFLYGYLNSSISFGYRWKYVGVYLNQDLGGIYGSKVVDPYDDDVVMLQIKSIYDTNSWFLGGTFVSVRGMLPLLDNSLELSLSAGIGIMYSNEGSDYVSPLTYSMDNSDPVPWFAVKFGTSATYYINDHFGFGVDFYYSLALMSFHLDDYAVELEKPCMNTVMIKFYKEIIDHKYRVKAMSLIHIMNPGVHVRVHF